MVSLYPESCTTDTVEQLMDQEVILAGTINGSGGHFGWPFLPTTKSHGRLHANVMLASHASCIQNLQCMLDISCSDDLPIEHCLSEACMLYQHC